MDISMRTTTGPVKYEAIDRDGAVLAWGTHSTDVGGETKIFWQLGKRYQDAGELKKLIEEVLEPFEATKPWEHDVRVLAFNADGKLLGQVAPWEKDDPKYADFTLRTYIEHKD